MKEFVELDEKGVITLAVIIGVIAVIMGIKEIISTIRYNKKNKSKREQLSKEIKEYLNK